jgi:hypothetical protein
MQGVEGPGMAGRNDSLGSPRSLLAIRPSKLVWTLAYVEIGLCIISCEGFQARIAWGSRGSMAPLNPVQASSLQFYVKEYSDDESMGIWHRMAMDSLKCYPGPSCPRFLSCGSATPEIAVLGVAPTSGQAACGHVLLP